MAQTLTPAKVAEAKAQAKADAAALDAPPPVIDPVHSLLTSMVAAMGVLAGLVPNAHQFERQHLIPLRAALAAITNPPK
jgi:hypothetical protein